MERVAKNSSVSFCWPKQRVSGYRVALHVADESFPIHWLREEMVRKATLSFHPCASTTRMLPKIEIDSNESLADSH